MAITLPLPVRVAAGLVATGIQLVRSLPEEIPAIPVALVGNAMRLSMKVQQEITTLATRGDELLGGFIGARPEASPGWATFDEDTATAPVKAAPARSAPAAAAPPAQAAPAEAARPQAAPPKPAAASPTESGPTTPPATALSDTTTTAIAAAAEVADSVVEAATHAVPERVPERAAEAEETADPPAPDGVNGSPTDSTTDSTTGSTTEGATNRADDRDGPATLPGYDTMTLAQVRGHLRELSAEDVSTLLAYEQAGDNRAPFLTLLSNRLVTLGASES